VRVGDVYRYRPAALVIGCDTFRCNRQTSCAVYGTPDTMPLTEDLPCNPVSPYARAKYAIEWALEDCNTAWGLGYTALRYFNAAGAASDGKIGEDHSPESHLIPIVLQVALGQREQVKIFGTDYNTPDGSCLRDYIHVEDLADAHAHVRKLVKRTINDWVEAQYGEARYQVDKKTSTQLAETFRQCLGKPPMYYLWDRKGAYPVTHLSKAKPEAPSIKRVSEPTATSKRSNGEKRRHRPDASGDVRSTRTRKHDPH